jgi:hypothetical protein
MPAGYFWIRDDREFTRAMPSLAPVRWLHARPSVFWGLPEREFCHRACRAQAGAAASAKP